jgi:hypothetical protein
VRRWRTARGGGDTVGVLVVMLIEHGMVIVNLGECGDGIGGIVYGLVLLVDSVHDVRAMSG